MRTCIKCASLLVNKQSGFVASCHNIFAEGEIVEIEGLVLMRHYSARRPIMNKFVPYPQPLLKGWKL